VPASSGVRIEIEIPCDGIVPVAPLSVEVRPSGGERGGEAVVQVCAPESRPALPDGDRMDDVLESIERLTRPFSWGRMAVLSPDFSQPVPLAAGATRVIFAAVPLGAPCVVLAYDQVSGAFGRTFFVHDGSDRMIELEPPWIVRGRFAPSGPDPLPKKASLWWAWRTPTPRSEALAETEVELGPDGSFEIRGPSSFPLVEADPLVPLSAIRFVADVAGFEKLYTHFETTGAREHDCGTIELAPRARGLTFVSTAEFDVSALSVASIACLAIDGGKAWQRASVGGSRIFPDGRAQLFFDGFRDWAAERLETYGEFDGLEEGRFGGEHVTEVVVDPDETKPFFFERRSKNAFVPIELATRRVEITCTASPPPPARTWNVGWRWHGIPQAKLRISAGQRRDLSATLPAHGVELWWSTSTSMPPQWNPLPGEGGRVELAPDTQHVSIP
jgi:hypothetical protein